MVQRWLCHYYDLEFQQYASSFITHHNQAAVAHIMKLASGLDSMVLGEPQILGQIKQAFMCALDVGTVGKLLHRLFQTTFSAAKEVRTQTAISRHPVSLAFAAVKCATHIFSKIENMRVLVIGVGEMNELSVQHFKSHGVTQFIFANRTVEAAQKLAQKYHGEAITLAQVPNALVQADIVITATRSTLPILGKGAVESALKKRKHKQMLFIDLAMPRDVEPEVATLGNVYLYTVDDLQEYVQIGLEMRQHAAQQALAVIDAYVVDFMNWWQSLTQVEAIKTYRNQGEYQRDQALMKAKRLLAQGKSPEEVVEILAHRLSNQLMHQPTVQLRALDVETRFIASLEEKI
jgi:glutamyl-tRNA reductase